MGARRNHLVVGVSFIASSFGERGVSYRRSPGVKGKAAAGESRRSACSAPDRHDLRAPPPSCCSPSPRRARREPARPAPGDEEAEERGVIGGRHGIPPGLMPPVEEVVVDDGVPLRLRTSRCTVSQGICVVMHRETREPDAPTGAVSGGTPCCTRLFAAPSALQRTKTADPADNVREKNGCLAPRIRKANGRGAPNLITMKKLLTAKSGSLSL